MEIFVTQLAPQDDRVIIKPVEEETTKGGIIIPTKAVEEKPHYGHIVVVGPNNKNAEQKTAYEKGMFVMYGKYAGTELDLYDEDGQRQKYIMLRAGDIHAIIKDRE